MLSVNSVKLRWLSALAVVAVLGSQCSAGAELTQSSVQVGRFQAATTFPPEPWGIVHFDHDVAKTVYRIVTWDGIAAVEATAEGSMALLARPLRIDLEATPVLCWRWRVDAPLAGADMARKRGDDYAARVYVAFDLADDSLSWQTKMKLRLARQFYGDQVPDAALNYVWDNRYPVGTHMPNAYTDRTRMVVLQSGTTLAGHWVSQRRDVLADARDTFDQVTFDATLLAIASDTDNTGEYARAGFADLHFVGAQSDCDFTPPVN